ncbi:MAG: type III-B CRISPR module-associated protein Cmr5 [Blastocatellia bacterium]|nr:type III-B CRISPR module-associated protein Cmr5 [Blastocatellia bacterium]
MNSLQQTKEQKRAKAAWDDITSIKDKGFDSEYSATAKNFPMMVLTNGLGQALAFLRAKNKDEHKSFYKHISCWVTQEIFDKSDEKLLEYLLECDSHIYRRSTTEALAFAVWLKRFAEAELDEKKKAKNNSDLDKE